MERARVITRADIIGCCSSRQWAELVTDGFPYSSVDELVAASDEAFDALTELEWRDTFAGCARIGVLMPGDDHGPGEQAGVAGAGQDVLDRLASANDAYESKFGFIFMIRATGRTAQEMLDALQARLANTPDVEFATACEQQRQIVTLRLRRLR